MNKGVIHYKNIVAIPPGLTIKELLHNRKIKQRELALKMGCSEKYMSRIVSGRARISVDMAIKLKNALGMPAAFWLRLEYKYRLALAEIEALKIQEGQRDNR